jgi:hypothetical protein
MSSTWLLFCLSTLSPWRYSWCLHTTGCPTVVPLWKLWLTRLIIIFCPLSALRSFWLCQIGCRQQAYNDNFNPLLSFCLGWTVILQCAPPEIFFSALQTRKQGTQRTFVFKFPITLPLFYHLSSQHPISFLSVEWLCEGEVVSASLCLLFQISPINPQRQQNNFLFSFNCTALLMFCQPFYWDS